MEPTLHLSNDECLLYLVTGFINNNFAHLTNQHYPKELTFIIISYFGRYQLISRTLQNKLQHRVSKECVFGIGVSDDIEVMEELQCIVQQSNGTMDDAVRILASQLPFEHETCLQVATTMIKHFNDTQPHLHLIINHHD